MMSLSDDKQADIIDAFNTTSKYLDDILNINNVYFDNIVSQIYPSELKLNKTNTSDTVAAFLDLHLSVCNDIVPTKRATCIKRLFWPPMRQKMKFTFHQILFIRIMAKVYKSDISLTFTVAMVTKLAAKIGRK